MQCNVKCTVQRHIVGELERESQVRECDAACFQLPSFSFSSSVCEAKTKSVDLKRDESIFSPVVHFRPRLPACLAHGFLQLWFLLPWSSSVLTYKPMSPWGILTQFNQSKHGYNHQNSMRGRCDHLSRAKLILGRPPRLTSIRIIVIGNNRNM